MSRLQRSDLNKLVMNYLVIEGYKVCARHPALAVIAPLWPTSSVCVAACCGAVHGGGRGAAGA
jgi:hypothetical protein